MNSTNLKIIACVTMLIDHIGAVLLPDLLFLRLIGRVAFPIFAFLIAQGYIHTHNSKKYLIRLFIFALISEIPNNLAFKGQPICLGSTLNIFFTLFLGLLAIYIYDHYKKLSIIPLIIIVVVAHYFKVDYGIYGIAMIFSFYFFRDDFYKQMFGLCLVSLGYEGYIYIRDNYINYVQMYSLASLIILYFYNGKKGYNLKYLFYFFYPVHLIILTLIRDYILGLR